MKKMYQTPNMELTMIYAEDVISTSIDLFNDIVDPYAIDKATWDI